jgi:hypothetical protein
MSTRSRRKFTPEFKAEADTEAHTRRLVRQLEKLGHKVTLAPPPENPPGLRPEPGPARCGRAAPRQRPHQGHSRLRTAFPPYWFATTVCCGSDCGGAA